MGEKLHKKRHRNETNEKTEFETKVNEKEFHKAKKKAKKVSIDGEADEVKEASMEIHNGGDGNVIEKKERKKKHKDKGRDGADRVPSLNEIIEDNKVDELVKGQICDNSYDDPPKMNVEEGGAKNNKKRKKEKEGDIVEKNVMTNGQKLAKERNHSDGKIREEVKLALKEKKSDRIVEDNTLGEVHEEQNCHESGVIAESNEEERGTCNRKRRKKEKLVCDVVGERESDGMKKEHSDGTILEEGEFAYKEEKKKKKKNKKKKNQENSAGLLEALAEELDNDSSGIQNVGNVENEVNAGSIGSCITDTVNAEDGYKVKKAKSNKHCSKDKKKNTKGDKQVSDGTIIKESEFAHKERKNKKKYQENNLGAGLQEALVEKPDNESGAIQDVRHVENEVNVVSNGSGITDAVNADDGYKVKKSKSDKHCSRDKMKKTKRNKQVSNGRGHKGKKRTKNDVEQSDISENAPLEGSSKRVCFSDHVDVEVFSPSDSSDDGEDYKEVDLRGKRFSKEEDGMIMEAVNKYVVEHCLGDNGLDMVLHCKKHPQVRGCWKQIGAALPWRTSVSIYYRAHTLFERGDERKWTDEERELIKRFHEKHGPNWKLLADALHKHRIHVKDAYRRIKLPNLNKGRWSQEEYQNLFDLVNLDLRMRAFEERKSKHGMLRDAISWEAISEKLSTRSNASCCTKWYNQLGSSMAANGIWADTDDYCLVDALLSLDATCIEDVDWDNLLEHRPGDLCRKRWSQMVKHIGDHADKPFADQVEVLSKRYCLDVLEAREVYNSKPFADKAA